MNVDKEDVSRTFLALHCVWASWAMRKFTC